MKRFWQIANIAALGFALVMNFLVGAQVVDQPSIGDVSDKYSTLLTPASYAFSIWPLIYILLIVFVIYQARDIFKPRSSNDLPQKVGPYFIIASILNGLWTYVFVSELVGLSVAILVLLTVSLYVLLKRLRVATYDPSLAHIAAVWWPLMIYTGWVTVASVVNIASWLDSLGFTITPIIASLTLIGLTFLLMTLLAKRHVRELVLASAWGIAAIGVNLQQAGGDSAVMAVAFCVSGVLLFATAIHAYVHRPTSVGKAIKSR